MKIKTALAVMGGAAWVLAAGLLLPHVANVVQDRLYAGKAERYETAAVEFDRLVAWGFVERLCNAGVGMVQAERKEGDSAEAEAISAAAQQALEEMERCGVEGIRADELTQTSITPLVVVARDSRQALETDAFKTYNAWRCIYVDASGNEMGMMFDSQSQKVIAALYLRAEETGVTREQAEQTALHWAKFCELYYGFTLNEIEQNQTSENWSFEMRFTGAAGEIVKLSYSVGEKSIQFQ